MLQGTSICCSRKVEIVLKNFVLELQLELILDGLVDDEVSLDFLGNIDQADVVVVDVLESLLQLRVKIQVDVFLDNLVLHVDLAGDVQIVLLDDVAELGIGPRDRLLCRAERLAFQIRLVVLAAAITFTVDTSIDLLSSEGHFDVLLARAHNLRHIDQLFVEEVKVVRITLIVFLDA